ncbi:MAG: aminoacyl-tRNA hydrolase [Candidatus Pacebacteria bacterium]|nr:aminoacyl-tRNA hydrolase [Candidatus Paceibacterota bacterium]
MQYIVALGNPGKEYENTRHNVGFLMLDYLVREFGWSAPETKMPYEGLYTKGKIGEMEVIGLFPSTFMNNSGLAIKKLVPKTELENLVVIYDDVDLPLGKIKVSKDRGDGGHNGIKSIIQHLETKDFVRVRVGIAPVHAETGLPVRPEGERLGSYVLNKFSKRELEELEIVKARVKELLEMIMKDGVAKAMNKFNEG